MFDLMDKKIMTVFNSKNLLYWPDKKFSLKNEQNIVNFVRKKRACYQN